MAMGTASSPGTPGTLHLEAGTPQITGFFHIICNRLSSGIAQKCTLCGGMVMVMVFFHNPQARLAVCLAVFTWCTQCTVDALVQQFRQQYKFFTLKKNNINRSCRQ